MTIKQRPGGTWYREGLPQRALEDLKPMTATGVNIRMREGLAAMAQNEQPYAIVKWLEEVTRIVRDKLIEEGKLVPGEWDFKLEVKSK